MLAFDSNIGEKERKRERETERERAIEQENERKRERARENKSEWNGRVKLYMIWRIELHEYLINNNVRKRYLKSKINYVLNNEILKRLISLEIFASDSLGDFLSLHWHENIVFSRQFV